MLSVAPLTASVTASFLRGRQRHAGNQVKHLPIADITATQLDVFNVLTNDRTVFAALNQTNFNMYLSKSVIGWDSSELDVVHDACIA